MRLAIVLPFLTQPVRSRESRNAIVNTTLSVSPNWLKQAITLIVLAGRILGVSRTTRKLNYSSVTHATLLTAAGQSVDEVGAAKPNAFSLRASPSTLLRVCVSLRQRGKAGSG